VKQSVIETDEKNGVYHLTGKLTDNSVIEIYFIYLVSVQPFSES
jgi:hypothetical protein